MLQNVGTLEMLLIGAFLLGGVGAVGVIVWALKRESKLKSSDGESSSARLPKQRE